MHTKLCTKYLRFQVSTVVNMKNAVFWGGSCKNDVSEEISVSKIMVTKNDEIVTPLAVTSNRRTL
jgi:hypothetical protein